MQWKVQNKKKTNEDNRINIVLAIIFLFGISLIYRLYGLQILEHELYVAKADSQHKSENVLIPNRGRIFIENSENKSGELYPVATNKDFAFLYTVPKNIKKPYNTAELLYKYFNETDVITEVDEFFKEIDQKRLKQELEIVATLPEEEQEAKRQEITLKHTQTMKEPEFVEFRELKRKSELDIRKNKVLDKYLIKLTKKDDPYEPLHPKVNDDILLNLYFDLIQISERKNLFYSRPVLSNSAVDTLLNGVTIDNLSIKGSSVLVQGSDGVKRKVNPDGIGFFMKQHRYYPENNIGSHMLGFVRKEEDQQIGKYGLEGFFNEELSGKYGKAHRNIGGRGELIVVDSTEDTPAKDGQDLVLTIDRTIQYTVCNMVNEQAELHQADGAAVIIMEPLTGAIISMCAWPDYDPNNYRDVEDIRVFNNPIIYNQYEPGSVFKTFTLAAAIDREKVTPKTTYKDKGFIMIDGWPKPIRNSDYSIKGGHGVVDMNTVLEESLNTGSIFAMRQAGKLHFAEYVRKFGFGEKTGIELNAEVKGSLGKIDGDRIAEIYAATASFGQGFLTTPLQLVNAYSAIANNGILMKPHIVKRVIEPDGKITEVKPISIRRVISEKTSALIGGMLANVVESGHAKHAAVEGYWVGGKTGTAQVASRTERGYGQETIHTFIGYAPIEKPKFVMLVRIDNPKDVEYSASSAAPLFGRISSFLLDYWQVPIERKKNK